MDEKVKGSLETLHGQLSDVTASNEAQQAHLDEVRQAVRNSLDHPDESHHLTLRERLEKASVNFEVEHPQIATALRTAIDVLADAGF